MKYPQKRKPGQLIDKDMLLEKGINILMEKLEPVETSRFLTLPPQKRIESVKRHHKWQAALDKDPFFDEVFKT